jgi:hypothetical protein
MDKGPWELFFGKPPERKLLGVMSNDFHHDVVLRVDGDFENDEDKERYCNWLLTRLNQRCT